MPEFMPPTWRSRLLGAIAAVALAAVAGLLIVRNDIAARREAFLAEARAAHRMLSQRVAQHEAILATLALNAPAAEPASLSLPLPPGYPQLLSARREPAAQADRAAEPATVTRWQLEDAQASAGRYALRMAHQGAAYQLQIDARELIRDEAWPWPVDGPVRAVLEIGSAMVVLQPGAGEGLRPAGLTEGFRWAQPLASDTQPFGLRIQRWTGPAEWPWPRLLLAAAVSAALVVLVMRGLSARQERRRSAELQRLARVARLNTMGELAAGMAHELNQPLTAMLAGTQTALRVLREAEQDEDPAATAIPALELAAAQARRAGDVVARLRSLVQQPAMGPAGTAVDIAALAQHLIELLAPEWRQRGISAECTGTAPAVRGDRVALEQILHNLLLNAAQALERLPGREGQIRVSVTPRAAWVDCTVQDNGPGIPAEQLTRVFEPFFSTREGGLGLGLSLCQTLSQAMGGQLTVAAAVPQGAAFTLSLPMAEAEAVTSRPPLPADPSPHRTPPA